MQRCALQDVHGMAMLELPPRPNMVLIMADDLMRTTLSAYGFPSEELTPRLNALGGGRNGSVALTNAFTTSSICSPSRVSFMTGRYASLMSNDPTVVDFGFGNRVGMASVPTLHRTLRQVGYRTGFFGKYHIDETLGKLGTPQSRLVEQVINQTGCDEAAEIYRDNPAIGHSGHHPEAMSAAAVAFVERHVRIIMDIFKAEDIKEEREVALIRPKTASDSDPVETKMLKGKVICISSDLVSCSDARWRLLRVSLFVFMAAIIAFTLRHGEDMASWEARCALLAVSRDVAATVGVLNASSPNS